MVSYSPLLLRRQAWEGDSVCQNFFFFRNLKADLSLRKEIGSLHLYYSIFLIVADSNYYRQVKRGDILYGQATGHPKLPLTFLHHTLYASVLHIPFHIHSLHQEYIIIHTVQSHEFCHFIPDSDDMLLAFIQYGVRTSERHRTNYTQTCKCYLLHFMQKQ